MNYKKAKFSLINNTTLREKLTAVKLLKEISGIGLKEAKLLIDDLIGVDDNNIKKSIFVDISVEVDKKYWKQKFSLINIRVDFDERERKMKRLKYSNQKILISDMLSDMGNWEKYVDKNDLGNLSYNSCKKIAVQKIMDTYEEYIDIDFFEQINNDISRINKIESKPLLSKFIKFNEEYGEFNAEYLKFLGHTYKPYIQEDLLGEMADSLQVLLSIFNEIGKETGITINDILKKVQEKNIKWENKIKYYTENNSDEDLLFLT